MATIASIQKLLSKSDCEKILRRSLDHPGQLLSYRIIKFHEEVAGFLGDHLQLTIKYTSNNTVTQKTYFMKTLPQFNLNQLDYVIEAGVFQKEAILYQNLLAELLKVAPFGPRCYYIKDNLIVLEDMKSKGFRMLPKHGFLDEEHTCAMLKTLARFHASTMVYEKKFDVKLDQKFPEEIRETCFSFVEGQPRQKWLVTTTKAVCDLIRLLPIKCDFDRVCKQFKKLVSEEMPHLIAPSKKFRNVLTHDDLWCNNLLFNEKLECVFVDFQLVRYTPPALDFLTALFLNLDCNYVEKNLDGLADIYYCYLEQELKKNNLDSNQLLKSEFKQCLDYYKLTALTETALYGTHIYISEELSNHIIEDLDNFNTFSFINRSKFAVKEFQDNQQYRDRLSVPLTLLAKALI